jgi:plastocyanin
MYPLLATRSAPMSYSPDTKYFYATAAVAPFWVKRAQDPHYFSTPNQVPGQKSYGIIAAIDSTTNKIAWQKKMPYRLEMGSGMTATAGGLVFHGEPDGLFQAYDAKTGDVLWEFQTGSNGSDGTALYDVAGSVASYEVDGEQYVTLVSGGALWSFKLGGKVPPLPRAAPRPTETSWVGRIQSGDAVSIGVTTQDTGLEKVRESYDEYALKPTRLKVKAGTAVTFTNTGKEPHAPTAQDGSWTAGELAPGKANKVTFDKPGQYTYIDKLHPWVFGQVIVE